MASDMVSREKDRFDRVKGEVGAVDFGCIAVTEYCTYLAIINHVFYRHSTLNEAHGENGKLIMGDQKSRSR